MCVIPRRSCMNVSQYYCACTIMPKIHKVLVDLERSASNLDSVNGNDIIIGISGALKIFNSLQGITSLYAASPHAVSEPRQTIYVSYQMANCRSEENWKFVDFLQEDKDRR
uniref:Uncharacterized protein n=1 Tax=Glossina pallidipes TaxID=7398 RepID=A0A1A9ZHQ4_GLOPL